MVRGFLQICQIDLGLLGSQNDWTETHEIKHYYVSHQEDGFDSRYFSCSQSTTSRSSSCRVQRVRILLLVSYRELFYWTGESLYECERSVTEVLLLSEGYLQLHPFLECFTIIQSCQASNRDHQNQQEFEVWIACRRRVIQQSFSNTGSH